MQSLTITTSLAYPDPPANLQPLAEYSRQRGIAVQFTPWQQVQQAEGILPICAWDYAQSPAQFQQWIRQMQHQGSRFINSPDLMLWNMHKSYLCDLQAKALRVIPTQILAADEAAIYHTMAAQHWHTVVLKPAIGQSGNGVVKYRQGETLPDLTPYQQGLVLQPFIEEVARSGEISLIFFHGEFSHAVRRQPNAGDFRANSAYGVQILPFSPSSTLIQQAQQVLNTLPEMPCYARVDGTVIDHDFLLNELELIEPALYLHTAFGATERLCSALLR